MNPISNPFAPGAGTPPPELAGRGDIREKARIAIERTRVGRPTQSLLMLGLRGVGKTVLLECMRRDAEASGIQTLRAEAPEGRSLPSLLAPELRLALIKLSRHEQARELAQRALRALAGFVGALKVKYRDVEVGLDMDPEPGLADNGDLEHDLQELLQAVAMAAQQADTSLAIFLDELQYVAEDELAALIVALHRVSQLQLPVILVGAGLPQLRAQMGRAKSYAERLFAFFEIGPLPAPDAQRAIRKPLEDEGASIEDYALSHLVNVTQGYPYFLQEWGKYAWDQAQASPITIGDVHAASELAVAELDASFFRVRFDRLTPLEKHYLRAMAELGPGPHRSGDIAEVLQRAVSSLAPTRAQLIAKGMIWSPSYGDTAFTVPLFDDFMRRTVSF